VPADHPLRADAVLILTEWKEFANIDLPRLNRALRLPIIIDGRNLYSPALMTSHGFTYIASADPRSTTINRASQRDRHSSRRFCAGRDSLHSVCARRPACLTELDHDASAVSAIAIGLRDQGPLWCVFVVLAVWTGSYVIDDSARLPLWYDSHVKHLST